MSGTITSKQKGDLLEKIVGQLCEGIKNAKVQKNIKVTGKAGTERQIDVQIEGLVGAFDVKIIIDSKNYANPVDIKDVEIFISMVEDLGGNLGVMVCPSGFTEGARNRATTAGLQLYEIYDHSLDNTNLFIPLRYVASKIDKYQFSISGSSATGGFSIPLDPSRWELHIDDKILLAPDVPVYIWNKDMIPQEKGNYKVRIGAIKIIDLQNRNSMQYCDLDVDMIVKEDYFLKLFPASFIRKVDNSGKEYFNLRIDLYSKEGELLKHGWQHFDTFDDMNKAADIDNQPQGIRELIMREHYALE
jgi:hypothetical protein